MPSKRKATFESSASSASSVAFCSIGEVKKLKVTQAARRIAKRKQSDGLAKSKRVKTDEQLNKDKVDDNTKVEDKGKVDDKAKVDDKDEDEAQRRSDATKNAFSQKTKAQAPEVRDVFGPDVKLLCKYLLKHSDFFQACIEDQDGDQDEDQDEDQDDSDKKEEEQLVMVHTLLSSCKEEDVQVLMKMSKNEMSPDMLRVADFYGIPMKQVATILDSFTLCDTELVEQARRAGMPRLPSGFPGLEMATLKYKLVRNAPLDAQKEFVKQLCQSFVPVELTTKREGRFYLNNTTFVFPRSTIWVNDKDCSFLVFAFGQLKRGFYDDFKTTTTLKILDGFHFDHVNLDTNTAVFLNRGSIARLARKDGAHKPAKILLEDYRETSIMMVNLAEPHNKSTFFPTSKLTLTNTCSQATTIGAMSVLKSVRYDASVGRESAYIVLDTLDQTILCQVRVPESWVCKSSKFFAYACYSACGAAQVVLFDARQPQIKTILRVLDHNLATFGVMQDLSFDSAIDPDDLDQETPTLFLDGKRVL